MRAIVSVIGKDRKGIIANVSMTLFKNDINILDISQTIMQNEYFTMIMMVELPEKMSVEDINAPLRSLAKDLGVEIRIQHEDIFNSMHRM
ncbi:MAG TPA: ACT domain-containing protein [Clostridia bacterium]|jgi:ACT domain-containing protein|nr:ACT domain-containing protein [Clostridia bacterium]